MCYVAYLIYLSNSGAWHKPYQDNHRFKDLQDFGLITGNTAANVLIGGAGADILIGGVGNDKLSLGLNDNVIDNVNYVFGDGLDTVT